MTTRVKICGITRPEDARAAVEAGADALGFLFAPSSPRVVTRPQAAAILQTVPPFVARVGVFVNPAEEEVLQAIAECRINVLQFHGEETPEFCRQFGLPVLKAFRILDADSLKPLQAYEQETWLLDSFVRGKHGGTGATFNWNLAAAVVQKGGRVILAGGLTPENAAEAVRRVRPYALDVSSGVESAPGKKDAAKIQAFIRAAQAA